MKRKNTIIGACSLAIVFGAGIIVFGTGEDTKKVEKKAVVVEKQSEEVKPVASGVTNISSVGASSVIDNMNTTAEQMSAVTGNINYFNVGFASVVEGYHDYLYDGSASDEEVKSSIKDIDIATGIVPEGSILAGYTNLGISNVTSYLNVRSGAGTSYKIIGKMPGNCACEILEEKDGWYKVKSGEVTGYVSTEYIVTGYDANVLAKDKMTQMLEVNCDKLNVREEPSTDCSISTKVSQGEHLSIVEDVKDGWYKAEINGLTGYVSAEYVNVIYTLPTAVAIKEVVKAPASNGNGGSSSGSGQTYSNLDPNVSQTAIDLINTAYNYLGVPYVYGGNSLKSGVDCSGFVKAIFGMYGYSLPRTSREYVNVGTKVPLSEIKPGDILIYKYGSRIGHVAIYIGDGRIIHAANDKKGVCIGNYAFIYPYMAVRVIP